MNNNSIHKPLASLVVLFYNHEKFVSETIAGALSQTYPNCELIFSDDGSSDDTFFLIQEAIKDYHGPHKIIVNKNETNMGLVPHINKLLFNIASGDIICLNGGDDISYPNRIQDTVDYFMSNPLLTAVTMSYDIINQYGETIGNSHLPQDETWTLDDRKYLISSSFMWGSTALSFKRSILDSYGPLSDDCQTEDSVLRFRSILQGTVLSSSKVGIIRRIHGMNLSFSLDRFDTRRIANQYIRDLQIVSNKLSPSLVGFLRTKVCVFIIVRNLETHQSGVMSTRVVGKYVLKLIKSVSLQWLRIRYCFHKFQKENLN